MLHVQSLEHRDDELDVMIAFVEVDKLMLVEELGSVGGILLVVCLRGDRESFECGCREDFLSTRSQEPVIK
jgi:hypothetical protein